MVAIAQAHAWNGNQPRRALLAELVHLLCPLRQFAPRSPSASPPWIYPAKRGRTPSKLLRLRR
jgi:hypothetical protein